MRAVLFYRKRHALQCLLSSSNSSRNSSRGMATKRPRSPQAAGSAEAAAAQQQQLPPPAKRQAPTRKRTAPREPGPGVTDLGQGASITFVPHLFPPSEAVALMKALQAGVAWEQREIVIVGKPIMQPRLISYMADDESLQYTYSGKTLRPDPWNEAVLRVKDSVEKQTGATFNSCLLNYYRDGGDSISYHSDNDRLYGKNPLIASVSLGEARDFLLRRNSNHADLLRLRLGGGSLLLMAGTTQEHWMHSVPKRAGVAGGRINLTFRNILFPERGGSG